MNWTKVLKNNFTSIEDLSKYLEWSLTLLKKIDIDSNFPLNLPLRIAKKIKKNTLDDPILLQFIPLKKEKDILQKNFKTDPLCETNFQDNSLLQKYKSRCLLLTSDMCAMNCRFCFRRHNKKTYLKKSFDAEISNIKNNKSLNEVILSGGDPLSLNDNTLENLLLELNKISHIKRIRFHTRFIIGIPERISSSFIKILKNLNKQIIFVLHINHPKEIDEDIINAVNKLKKINVQVFNQAVLLKNVNDNLETLKNLSELLMNNGILFYYLHQLDKVLGAKHFEVSEKKGKDLIKQLQKEISGYGVPKYVKEEPFKKSKIIITF